MNTSVKTNFAQRLGEICGEMHVPAERGRQTALAKTFGVSPNAARKWLLGDGMPELDMVVRIANWAGVTVTWLLQGVGPKRSDHAEMKVLVLNEVIEVMAAEDRKQVLDFIRYKIERSDPPLLGERMPQYMKLLDGLVASFKNRKS